METRIKRQRNTRRKSRKNSGNRRRTRKGKVLKARVPRNRSKRTKRRRPLKGGTLSSPIEVKVCRYVNKYDLLGRRYRELDTEKWTSEGKPGQRKAFLYIDESTPQPNDSKNSKKYKYMKIQDSIMGIIISIPVECIRLIERVKNLESTLMMGVPRPTSPYMYSIKFDREKATEYTEYTEYDDTNVNDYISESETGGTSVLPEIIISCKKENHKGLMQVIRQLNGTENVKEKTRREEKERIIQQQKIEAQETARRREGMKQSETAAAEKEKEAQSRMSRERILELITEDPVYVIKEHDKLISESIEHYTEIDLQYKDELQELNINRARLNALSEELANLVNVDVEYNNMVEDQKKTNDSIQGARENMDRNSILLENLRKNKHESALHSARMGAERWSNDMRKHLYRRVQLMEKNGKLGEHTVDSWYDLIDNASDIYRKKIDGKCITNASVFEQACKIIEEPDSLGLTSDGGAADDAAAAAAAAFAAFAAGSGHNSEPGTVE